MSNGINLVQKPIRVAFLLIGGMHWMGGYNYLVNLLYVLKTKEDSIEPILFLGKDLDSSCLEPLQEMGYKIVFNDSFNIIDRKSLIMRSMLFGKNREVEQLFNNNQIDVVFEADTYLGWNMNVPCLAWIPDFQHKHLDNMFSAFGKIKRDLLYWLISKSRTVMLSSFDAKKDFNKYYNSKNNFSKVVSFATITPSINSSDTEKIMAKYNIENPYFYLPNQYWVHKNHKVVIEALNRLKEKGKKVVVVSSGGCQDKRNSNHYAMIENLVKQYRLEDHYIMLGPIPYVDVLHLAKFSCAVINPSYFEGWSTTVEEAKSLDIPLILSNLAVHHEQVALKGRYFSPDSADELASILTNFSCDKSTFSYGLNERDRLNQYATNFINALQLTMKNARKNS